MFIQNFKTIEPDLQILLPFEFAARKVRVNMPANDTRKDSIPDTVCGLGSNFQARKTRIVLIARGLKLDNKAYQEKVLDKLVPEKALWQRVHIHARPATDQRAPYGTWKQRCPSTSRPIIELN